MLEIDIYSNYKVTETCKWCENSEDYDDWLKRNETKNYNCSGYKLIEFIGNLLGNRDISEISIDKNYIYISLFDPTSGWCASYKFVLERIRE